MTFLSIGRVTFAALIAALFVILAPARADDADKGVLANLISQALSSPTTSVSIGAVDGVLSSDASISDIVLSDRDGPWLKIDKVRLVWRRLALLSRRLEVDQLTIGHMQVLRRPLPSQAPPPPDAGGPRSILPELPVKVVVKQFGIEELSLGEPLIGVAARLNIAGKATLGPPSEGLDLALTSRRLDAPGEFKALMTYVPATDKLTLSVNSDEPAGGLFAHLVNLPGLPPARLAFNGAGPLDNFAAKLDFSAGPDVWANGEVVVARRDAGRKLTLDLNSRLEGMTPPIIRPIFAGETTLKGDLDFNDDSTIVTPGLHLVSANARLDIEGGRSADDTLGIKIHAGAIPGATRIGKLDLNASIVGPALSPTLEGAFDAVRCPCRGRIARPCRRHLPRRPQRLARRRSDAHCFPGPGGHKRPCAGRPRARPGCRQRGEARAQRLGFARRRHRLRYARARRLGSRRPLFRTPRPEGRSRQAGGHRARPQPLRAARRNSAQGRGAPHGRPRRRAALWRTECDARRDTRRNSSPPIRSSTRSQAAISM